MSLVLLVAALAALSPPADGVPVAAPWQFVDVAVRSGVDFIQRSGDAAQRYIVDVKSTGVALLDVDGDGRLDLFFTAGSTVERYREGKPGHGCRLYANRGDWKFEDITEAAGLTGLGWACGAAAADVDGDGLDDLLVTCIGRDRLFLNRGGTFEDVTEECGLAGDGWSASAAFGDLDGDGDLDLYITGYLKFDFANPPVHGNGTACLWKEHEVMCGPRGLTAEPDQVYENLGHGKFRDVTAAWGFASVEPQYGLGVVIADLVGDGRPDVFVANDSSPNHLWRNRSTADGTRFEEVGFLAGVSVSEDGQDQAGMGIAVADVDANGALDLFVTNFSQERNNLYLNSGHDVFYDDADNVGIGAPGQSSLSWGTAIQDFDGDGRLDVFVANGHVYPQADQEPGESYAQQDHLYHGTGRPGGQAFLEEGASLGLLTRVSRGAAFGDLDGDGDLDLVVCHLNDRPAIYRNDAPAAHHFLAISLEQPAPNRQALGARVALAIGPVRRLFPVLRHGSFQSSSTPRLHVGLGTEAPAGTAEVSWPDGVRERFAVPAGTRDLKLVRGAGEAIPTDSSANPKD